MKSTKAVNEDKSDHRIVFIDGTSCLFVDELPCIRIDIGHSFWAISIQKGVPASCDVNGHIVNGGRILCYVLKHKV